jgi:hypothetical protein
MAAEEGFVMKKSQLIRNPMIRLRYRLIELLIKIACVWPLFLCCSAAAQEVKILDMLSPNLKGFLTDNPKAFQLLTNSYRETFSNRTMQVFYFYTDDKSKAQAYHYYPSESSVGIAVCENQSVLDQYLGLVFEIMNSEGEKAFLETYRRAALAEISKSEFRDEILKTEFKAVIKLQRSIRTFDFKKKEISESSYYKEFSECPDDFAEFVAYSKTNSTNRDPIRELEATYDSLQKKSNSTTQP